MLTGEGILAALALLRFTSKHQIAPAVIKQLEKAGPRGATGPAGVAGAAGTPGVAGAFSASNVTTVSSADTTIPAFPADQTVEATATCPAGDTVIGGGFRGGSTPPIDATVSTDGPSGTNAWAVSITDDNSGATADFFAEAVCAS